MTLGEIVARLIAAGTPPEVAAVAVADAFQAGATMRNSTGIPVDEAAERRRAYDRERKRKQKHSGGIPVETPRNSENAISSSVSTDSELKKEKKERKRGEKLSAEFRPSESHYLEGEKIGLSRAQVDGLCEDMRIWAGANEHRQVARKSNWDLTLLGWIRRQARDVRGRGPPRNRNGFLDLALNLESTSDERGYPDSKQIPVHGTEH